MYIPYILSHAFPDSAWRFTGADHDITGLDWQDKTAPKPTRAELKALWDNTYAALHAEDRVREARAEAYATQPVGDQLDAVIKAFDQLRKTGTRLANEMDDLINWSMAIKAELPKPDTREPEHASSRK